MTKAVKALPTAAEAKLAADFADARKVLPGSGAVHALRTAAFDSFVVAGLPSRRVEAWHYTDLRGALREALPMAAQPPASATSALRVRLEKLVPRIAGLKTWRLVLVDGYFIADLSDAAALPKGVRVMSLADALVCGDAAAVELLAARGLGESDAALALNTAFMQGGVLVDIAQNTTLEQPLEIVSLSSGAVGQAVYARSALRVSKGAQVTLIESEACESMTAEHRNCALVIAVGEGASVEHVFVPAPLASGSTYVASLMTTLAASANFNSFTLALGGGLLRRQAFMRFDGAQGRGQLAGASLLKGKDHADTTLIVQHVAPHCHSREYFKTVLDGDATGVYQGKVSVAPGAQKTDGAMKSHAILLSDGATMNNKPELEIFADDVVCGHGATVAQLDDDQVFYAMARGLPKEDAQAMLLEAFVDEATDRVENEALRAHLTTLIGAWLSARRS